LGITPRRSSSRNPLREQVLADPGNPPVDLVEAAGTDHQLDHAPS
jgi:hypothetical protein